MIDLNTVPHHPAIEEIAEVLAQRSNNTDHRFFRIVVAYYLAKMAGSMRAAVRTKFRNVLPVNLYTVALAQSGFGKGTSTNLMEDYYLKGFQDRFMFDTLPVLAEQHLWKRAIERAAMASTEEEAEKQKIEKEYNLAGAYVFTFSKATPAAIQQIRNKLLLAEAGAINLQIDEIGSNLVGATDVLNVFLELYDQGKIKQSVTKNTHESIRAEEIDGITPTNALLFGTPDKLLDGGLTEDHFYSFLDTGYARRCLFAWGVRDKNARKLTRKERYLKLTQAQSKMGASHWATHFTMLADPIKHGWEMSVDDTVGEEIIGYQILCEERAALLPDHEGIRKAELEHRYDRALKLAGTLAFIDESTEVTIDHFHQAAKIVEESGASFEKIMTREKSYVKLAKYVCTAGTDLTHADLHEALPFYKASPSARIEQMTMAQSWAYKQHMVITKRFEDGIELFSGKTLKETDTTEMIIALSDHWAYNYEPQLVPFESLHELSQVKDHNWTNHHFERKHRSDEATIPGFNMVVFDYDGNAPLDVIHKLLTGYRFMTYTTKSHDPEGEHRFRLLLPINYVLELDKPDYATFVADLANWLPIPSSLERDESPKQRSKKWLTHDAGIFHYGDGELVDCLPFIPRTSRNAQRQHQMQLLQSLDNLERWFAQRMVSGNRNNEMIKFALALVDSGMDYTGVEAAVFDFNAKLSNGLGEDELRSTVLVTAAKKIAGRP